MTAIQKIAETTKKINDFKKMVDKKMGEYQEQIQEYINEAQEVIDEARTKSKKAVMDEVGKYERKIEEVQKAMQDWVNERMKDLQQFVDDSVKSANQSVKQKLVQKQLAKMESAQSAGEAGSGKTASAEELENKKPLLTEEEQKQLCDSLPDPIPAPTVPEIEVPKIKVDLKSMIPDVWSMMPNLNNMIDLPGIAALVPSIPTGLTDKFSFPAVSQISDAVNAAVEAKNQG